MARWGTRGSMTIHATGRPPGEQDECRIRIAAAGDVHFGRDAATASARPPPSPALAGRADLVLLAGDLTTHGEPEQAAILAEAAAGLDVPVLTVLGNHDWHSNRARRGRRVLEEAGIVVLDRSHHVVEVCGARGRHRGRQGLRRRLHRARTSPTSASRCCARSTPRAWRRSRRSTPALRADRAVPVPDRAAALRADRRRRSRASGATSGPFLGTDRLAVPIPEHAPDLVLHGHAHAGTFAGRVGEVPVYNVSVPVMGEDWWVFEMSGDLPRPLRSALIPEG